MNAKTRFASLHVSVWCLSLTALAAAWPVPVEAAVAGRFQFVAGDVRVLDQAGRERTAQKGQDVNEGETVLTGATGSAQLKMIDSGVVAVRPGTQLKVVTYVFNGIEDGSENAVFSLLKGGLRAITGLIGNTHKERYRFETPTVVIGIRGTDHEPVVLLPAPPGVTATDPPGTYDKVNLGATSLTTEVGTIVVARNQVGYAAALNQLPVVLPKLPSFYQATPAPLSKQDKKQDKDAQGSGEQASSKASAGGDSAAAKTDAAETTSVAAAPNATLTGTDAQGNVLDLARQTLTTRNGAAVPLSGNAPANLQDNGVELVASYPFSPDANGHGVFPIVYFAGGANAALTRDAAGNLTGASDSSGKDGGGAFGSFDSGSLAFRSTLSQSGSNLTDHGSDAATGLSWGRWQGGQVTQSSQYFGVDANGNKGLGAVNGAGVFVVGATQTNSAALGNGSLHWLAGSSAAPGYLTRVLTGSAHYAMLGGTHPTDQLGNIGSLTSASLGVNFTTQVVNADVNFSIAGNSWGMQSNDMQLEGNHFFSRFTCGTSQCISSVSLSKNGVQTSATGSPDTGFSFGSMNGMLLGLGLNGAGLQYSVHDTVPTSGVDSSGRPIITFSDSLIQGVVGFTAPAQDVNTPFRAVGVVDGWDLDARSTVFNGDFSVNLDGIYRGSVSGELQPVGRVIDSAAGLTEFIGQARGYTPLDPSAPVPGIFDSAPDNTIKIGSAVNRDVGSATIGGATVSWGRWEGGSVDIYSRDGSVKLGAIDNSGRSLHWLTTSALNAAFLNLPLSGSAAYTPVGHTSPTDLKGNVGTLGAVTLNADFANAKVNAGLEVSFNASGNTSTWNMSANNIPLGGRDGFHSSSALNGVNGITHTVSCSGASCGPQTFGQLDGHFVAGGQGALMAYGMATGTVSPNPSGSPTASTFTPANAVTGLVVLRH